MIVEIKFTNDSVEIYDIAVPTLAALLLSIKDGSPMGAHLIHTLPATNEPCSKSNKFTIINARNILVATILQDAKEQPCHINFS